MSQIEKMLIDVAEQHVRELRYMVSTQETDDERANVDANNTLLRAWTLTELGHLSNSGLSDEGTSRLLELEDEANSLARTQGWLRGNHPAS